MAKARSTTAPSPCLATLAKLITVPRILSRRFSSQVGRMPRQLSDKTEAEAPPIGKLTPCGSFSPKTTGTS